jgi:hypothetical protein
LRWTVAPVRNVVSHAVIEFGRPKEAEACSCHPVRHGVSQGLDVGVGVGVGRGAGVLGWRISSHFSPRSRTKRVAAPAVAASPSGGGDNQPQDFRAGGDVGYASRGPHLGYRAV